MSFMKTTEQTLMHQMQISMLEIARRKQLLGLTDSDLTALARVRVLIEPELSKMVEHFYDLQTEVAEFNELIGDFDTLKRLKVAQHQYLLELFSGCYDEVYVNNRLRIGLVHKRIGVEPRYYLAALQQLKELVFDLVQRCVSDPLMVQKTQQTLEKLYMFDVTLVVETYVWSLINEVKHSKAKIEEYTFALQRHAQEMENLSRLDPLTGLLNVRHLLPILTEQLYRSQQMCQPLTILFIDINDFKKINDDYGHLYGDQVIQEVAAGLKQFAREEDFCFRYGGDEFLAILPNCTALDAKLSFIPRVEEHVHQFKAELSLSVGVRQADASEGYMDATNLLRAADTEMYILKKQHKSMQMQEYRQPYAK